MNDLKTCYGNPILDHKLPQTVVSLLPESKLSFININHSLYNLNRKQVINKILKTQKENNRYYWNFSHLELYPLKYKSPRSNQNTIISNINNNLQDCWNFKQNCKVDFDHYFSNNTIKDYKNSYFQDYSKLYSLIDWEENHYHTVYDKIATKIKELIKNFDKDRLTQEKLSHEDLHRILSKFSIFASDFKVIQSWIDELDFSRRLIETLKSEIKFLSEKSLKQFRNLRTFFKKHHSFHFKNLDDYHINFNEVSLFIKV